jgi:trehalose/maltose transport system substrate-binding protein
MNVFDSGGAAFDRVWLGTTAGITNNGQTRPLYWRGSLPVGKTGYTSIPGGSAGSAAALGGFGLAVSARSAHPQQAIELVRFLIHVRVQSSKDESINAKQPEVYNLPWVLDPHGNSEKPIQRGSVVVNRPYVEAGRQYQQVSAAYISAVHSVLMGERGAPEAAAELEKRLIKLTGFSTGPPRTD